ncbi:hypothetical protein LDENG_00035300 [Lucifuga dentata]|nr:hypothetical protein LDENG_00035300 [Lucifuga dentata]
MRGRAFVLPLVGRRACIRRSSCSGETFEVQRSVERFLWEEGDSLDLPVDSCTVGLDNALKITAAGHFLMVHSVRQHGRRTANHLE